jgi:hypothetical protein
VRHRRTLRSPPGTIAKATATLPRGSSRFGAGVAGLYLATPSSDRAAPSRPEGVFDLLARVSQVRRPLIGPALGLERSIVGRAADSRLHPASDLIYLVPGFIRTAHWRALLFRVPNMRLAPVTRFRPTPRRPVCKPRRQTNLRRRRPSGEAKPTISRSRRTCRTPWSRRNRPNPWSRRNRQSLSSRRT